MFVSYVTQVHVLWPWFRGSAWGLVHAALFQAAVCFVMWAYLRAATTDPGTVPRKTASLADVWPPLDDAERHWKPKRRYCSKCECIKPPRAHHCSTCQRCVNKMGTLGVGRADVRGGRPPALAVRERCACLMLGHSTPAPNRLQTVRATPR